MILLIIEYWFSGFVFNRWVGAQEKAAAWIGGNEDIVGSGFYGGANASLGLKMLTGQESQTFKLLSWINSDQDKLRMLSLLSLWLI